MHIKQITISNFRSFRQQPEIQPFSVATNCVVGRNGSGKSNLFDAVQFALLAPRFANLRQEERQAILHEGSGSAAVNAFVEIVFDNSDGRLSAADSSDEVVLRRTVGAKKDEFFLQRKRANKTEIQSLLEGAGFSKSNPYYIVQQGKVQDLCTMGDAERLALLKEVAGTTVYDEKKAESLVKMEENAGRIEKIDEILTSIEERLGELQSEKDELSQYQALDRRRRALEYTLYDKELRKARSALDALEHERLEHGGLVSELHAKSKSLDEDVRNLEGRVKAKHNELKRNRLQLQDAEDDAKGAVKRVAHIELECRDLAAQIKAGDEQLKTNAKELERVNADIAGAEAQLEQVLPQYADAQTKLQSLQDQKTQARSKQDALYAKQTRGQQFASRQERDAFLQSQLDELANEQASKEASQTQQRDRLGNLRRKIEQEQAEVQGKTEAIQQVSQNLQQLEKRREDAQRRRLQCVEERKDTWRQCEQLQEQVREARELFHRALSDARKTTPRATALGLEALPRLVQEEQLTGDQYMGTVLANLRLKEDRFATAVEVAAQNALFHVIVDTDSTAARLMKRLEDEQLGRVTFLPLNQLRPEATPPVPQGNNDVRPLLELCVEYDRRVERAMQHVFSKKLLARTAEIASEYSTQHSVDVLTLDGDMCSRKGAMSGGYVDTNQSRIKAHIRQKQAKSELQRLEGDHADKKRRAQQAEKASGDVQQELSRLDAKYAELERSVNEKERDVERLQTRLETHKKQASTTETKDLPALERGVEALKAERGRLEEEMGTELTDSLSEADRQTLDELVQLQADLTPQIEAQNDVVNQVGVQRQKLESLLQDNLYKRRDELTQGNTEEDDNANSGSSRRRRRSSIVRISSTALQAQRKEDLEERQRQLGDATRIKESAEERLAEARKAEQQLRLELEDAKNELEQVKNKDMKNQKSLEEAQEKSDRLWTKRSMCISKRESYMRKIQELGSLPPPAELEKFSGKSLQTLMTSLDDVNKKLKKYSHVNKKAYDQYVNFNEQRESLLKRKEELDQGAEKVKELVDSLDRQKDEAINRTFRGVKLHFKNVFKELVPNGEGELIMRTAGIDDDAEGTDNEESSSDEDDEEESESSPSKKKKKIDPKNPDVSLYRGIGIKVRFSSVGENYLMSQLSGGQKALVAMALIFAIQRCDPAPFYLFDELDQALDSTYRAAVANLIERQANDKENPTQFIVSTFRPELVSVANRCYGISHQNKVSSIHPLSKRDALSFVANLMNEEEAVGEVSTVPTASLASRFSRESRKRKSTNVSSKGDGGGGTPASTAAKPAAAGMEEDGDEGEKASSPSTAATDTVSP